MKKLSILILALAIAAFAVPAMADSHVSWGGEYTVGGESTDNSTTEAMYYDELDLDFEIVMDDVTFHWDIELYDDPYFDKQQDEGGYGDSTKFVDGLWVKWQITDALSTKIGEYGPGWGNDLVTDAWGGGNGTIGVMYALEGWDLGLYMSKEDEGAADGYEDDDETWIFTVLGTDVGPLNELGLYIAQSTNEHPDNTLEDTGTMSFIWDIDLGGFGIYGEYGVDSTDAATGDGGSILMFGIGMPDVGSISSEIIYYQTNEDWENLYGNDFDITKLFDEEPADASALFVEFGYGVNDDLTLLAAILGLADVEGDDAGTEIDLWLEYAFADNVSAEAGYATYSAGDWTGQPDDLTKMWWELVFGF